MEKRITGRTGMFCLIGTPVGHSGSPAMYNYSFAQTGLDYAYLAYDVPLEKTEEAVNALKVLGCKGFNVTMPCKTRVAELVDELSDAAKLIGACNTVVVKDGKLYGNNTDGMGFVRNLKENGVDVKGKKITVMGAGGAATAIQVQCALDGAKKISIFNRKDEFYANGEKTVKKIQQMVPDCEVSIHPLEETDALYAAIKDSDYSGKCNKDWRSLWMTSLWLRMYPYSTPIWWLQMRFIIPRKQNSCSPQRRQAVRSLSAAQVC